MDEKEKRNKCRQKERRKEEKRKERIKEREGGGRQNKS